MDVDGDATKMARYDSRSLRESQDPVVILNRGLDQTTTPMLSPPGTLSDCANVELIDNVLYGIKGCSELGTTALNRLPDDYYILYADQNNWTVSYTPDNFEPISWHEGNTLAGKIVGSGLVKHLDPVTGIADVNYDESFALMHIEGVSPTGYTYFSYDNAGTQSHALTIDSSETFELPSRYTTDITQNIHRQHQWSIFLEQTSSATWDAIRPKPLGNGGISHTFQLEDITYVVRDYLVGAFVDGEEEPSMGDKIQLDALTGTDPTFYVARAEVTGGSWEGGDATGWLYLYPQSDSTLVDTDTNVWNAQSLQNINNLTTANLLGTTPPQTGPATLDNVKSHGLMWKLDTDGRDNTGWKYNDMGYSLEFNTGLVAPLAMERPVFVTDTLATLQESGNSALVSPATEYPATGTYSAWTGLANLAADDGSNATSPVLANDYSRIIELQSTASMIPGDANIIGIEVVIEASQTVGTDAFIEKVQLRNDATGATEFLSADKGDAQALSTTPTVFTYGAQLDLFGLKELLQDTINDQDLTVLVQFGNSNGSTTRTVTVDYVHINVHYYQKGQDVYIYDGSSDVSTANLYAWQVHDGDWSTDNAQGFMTLHDVTTPSAVTAGMQIRSAASGGGDLIATTVEMTKNILPSLEEMEERGARSQYIVTSISGGEDNLKAFVTNGTGPAFAVDAEDRFQFIRTPVDRAKDRPRYVAEQLEHLALGLKEHVMVSSIATPNNFATYDGATSWSIGDEITGLIPAPDNTLIILGTDSIHRLSGSGATGQDNFRVSTHNSTGGGNHYSGVYAGAVLFLDDFGLTSLQVTQKFGDFDQGQMSYGVEEWLRERLQHPESAANFPGNGLLEVIPVRGKNQIRAYFNDGWILTMSFPPPGGQSALPQFTTQNYSFKVTGTELDVEGVDPTVTNEFKPTSLSSYITTGGEERLIAGMADGRVALLDDGLTIMVNDDLRGGFAVNAFRGDNPNTSSIKNNGITISYEKDHIIRLKATSNTDYMPPKWTKSNEYSIAGNGETTDQYFNRYEVGLAEAWIRDVSIGSTWRIFYQTDQAETLRPNKYIAISPKSSEGANKRARVSRSVAQMT